MVVEVGGIAGGVPGRWPQGAGLWLLCRDPRLQGRVACPNSITRETRQMPGKARRKNCTETNSVLQHLFCTQLPYRCWVSQQACPTSSAITNRACWRTAFCLTKGVQPMLRISGFLSTSNEGMQDGPLKVVPLCS